MQPYLQTVVISDTQYPWIDKPAEAAVQQFIADNQPDQIIQIGDFADFYSLATFRKQLPPSERVYLRREVETSRDKLREWGSLAPNARKVFIEGNHEARLARYLEDQGGELFDLNDRLTVPLLLETEQAGWEYVGPYGAGMWVGKPGGLWATHGNYARKASGASAKAHVEQYGHSIIHGHTHRLAAYHKTAQSAKGPRTISGYEVGCLCSLTKTPRATEVVDWQHGFAIVWTSPTTTDFHVDLVNIHKGKFVYAGVQYG